MFFSFLLRTYPVSEIV